MTSSNHITIVSILAAATAIASGCHQREPYACTASSQCATASARGICAAGFCALPDDGCPGGYRYVANAGAASGTCVAAPDAGAPDAAICGTVGAACCAGQTCSDGTCTDGTCRSCVADVTFGRRFGCTLRTDRTIWCSGDNSEGQLGSGIVGINSATPVQVRDGTSVIGDALVVDAGAEHTCAVRMDGTVWCWGDNDTGELGNNSTAVSPVAVQVRTVADQPLAGIVEVHGGDEHSCARDTANHIWCWGAGDEGQLGDGIVQPMRGRASRVLAAPMGMPFDGAVELDVHDDTNCVRRANGEHWCWGENDNAEIGDGTQIDRPNPISIGTFPAIVVGHNHICRLNADTTITCAGLHRHAVFGIGTGAGLADDLILTPVPTRSGPGGGVFTGATQIAAAGGSAMCAIVQDASVYCWGDGQYGQVGTGKPERYPAPVRRSDGTPLRGVDRLVAAYPHVCARVMSGEWLCWGRNSEGEFGDGAFQNRGFATPLRTSCP